MRIALALTVASALVLVGCGDDSAGSGGQGGAGGSGGAGGTGGGGDVPAACEGMDVSGCSLFVAPSEDDTTALQTAFIEASSGDTVCLCPGNYALENELQIDLTNLTVRGVGASREDVVLDFAGQIGGDDGITATGDGFTIEKLFVKNSPGNGIVVTGVTGVTFRDLKVDWDDPDMTTHGAYAVYPVKSTNVLIEGCEIIGANDAGAYVGQSTNIIVRDNDVHGNVAGIEIENSTDAEVYDNRAYDNSAGVLVFVLPDLEKKDGDRALIRDNEIYDNNRENTGSGVVGAVPPGTGGLILGADHTQFVNNNIHDNDSVGLTIVSHEIMAALVSDFGEDPETNGYSVGTYVSGNDFTNNGADPSGVLLALGVVPIENVLWDGEEETPGEAELCLSSTPPTFRNFHGADNIALEKNHTTDTTPHECDVDVLPSVEL